MDARANGKAMHRLCNVWRQSFGFPLATTPPAPNANVIPGVITWTAVHSTTWASSNLFQGITIFYNCATDSDLKFYQIQVYAHPSINAVHVTGHDRKMKFIEGTFIQNRHFRNLSPILAKSKNLYAGCNIAVRILLGEGGRWPMFAASNNFHNV